MQPVRQGVVHEQRHRQCRPPVDGHIFAPADAGIAVVRALRRVLQLLSYYTALERGCDIDKPRNLAKSVTVE